MQSNSFLNAIIVCLKGFRLSGAHGGSSFTVIALQVERSVAKKL